MTMSAKIATYALAGALVAAPLSEAAARDGVNLLLGVLAGTVAIAALTPPPVVVAAPPPAYYPPPVAYMEPPAYVVAPPPVYYGPVYAAPAPVAVYYGHRPHRW